MFREPFKPITITITRDEYNDLHEYKNNTQEYIYELWNEKRRLLKLYTEIQDELESYKLTKKLLNLQARTDKHAIKVLEKVVKEHEGNLQEKQLYCDYLEIESNKTEAILSQTQKELKAKNKLVEKVRAENDRLGEKLKIANETLDIYANVAINKKDNPQSSISSQITKAIKPKKSK